MPAAPATLAQGFAAFAAELDPGAIPQAVLERAKLNILDAIGIGLAASTFDFAERTAHALCAMAEPGESPVLGRRERLALRDAMLFNGVLVHGLDFDDTHGDSVVHCTASALPLMLGVGHARAVSGRRALAAYLIALELDARIGRVARGTLQRRGWHPTGVVGAFGCAAAAAYLLDADAAATANALGITLSMASGNLEFLADGAWTKRLHPGWAAVCGYTAARLGLAGFIGPSLPLEGRFGLYKILLGEEVEIDPRHILGGLGEEWAVFDNAFKPFPACHFLHAFIDCALACRAQAGYETAAIERIDAYIHPDEIAIVCEPATLKRQPRNAYDAQFSIYFAIAVSLLKGRFGLAELDDHVLADRTVTALAARVHYRVDPESAYPQSYSGALEIHLRDGRCIRHREQINRGAAGNPLSSEAIIAKFEDNAGRAVSESATSQIRAAVMALDTSPDLNILASAVKPAQQKETAP